MKLIVLVLVLSFILLFRVFTLPVIGQTPFPSVSPTVSPSLGYALPYAGILPDHPLYFLKQIRDKILILLTRDPLKKSQLYLVLADKSLVMGELLWEKENYNLSLKTFREGEKYLLLSALSLYKISDAGDHLPPGVVDKLELSAKKHEEIIMKLLANVQDSSRRKSLNEALSIIHQAMQKATNLKSL